MPGMVPKDKQAILDEFRQGLVNEGLIHDGDTIGTDDETLLYVLSFPILSALFPSRFPDAHLMSVHAVASCVRVTSTSSSPRSCGRIASTGAAPSRASASMSSTAK